MHDLCSLRCPPLIMLSRGTGVRGSKAGPPGLTLRTPAHLKSLDFLNGIASGVRLTEHLL